MQTYLPSKCRAALLIAAMLFSINLKAQDDKSVTSNNGIATSHAVINFNAIALVEAYNKPAPKPIQFIGNRKANPIPEIDIDPTGKTIQNDPFGKIDLSKAKRMVPNPSPSPIANFNGLNDNNTSIPPDVNGAVGPNHVMTTLNTQVRIADRNGVVLSTVTLNAFWASLGGVSGAYDPKVLYDHFSNRWIIVSSCNSQSNTSSTLLGASQTSDPTGAWTLYKVDVDATNQKWVDYPSIGFNDKWIVVQMNLFAMSGFTATAHQIYVWNKADVYAGGTGQYKLFNITTEATAIACPSIHYDNSIGKMYTIRVSTGNSGGNGRLGLRTITGTVGNELLSAETIIQTPNPWASTGNSNTNFAPQLGTTKTVATNDHRMRQVVVRDGKIYAVHSVFLPSSGATRSSVQWWQLDSAGAILQRNLIDDPTGEKFFSFPSIAVNKLNDVLIGYASFSAKQYPSGSYSFRTAADPINTLRDEYLFKGGENVYFKDFGGTRNRWGDYTNTVIDPINDTVFWTVQEYAGYTANTWATWWAKIHPSASVADFASDKTVICPGEVISYTNTSNFSGSNFSWTFQGGTPATSSLANPVITYNTAGRFKVTLTVDGKLQDKDGYVIVNTLPNKATIVSANNLCEGKNVTLTASQAGGTYLWNTGATTRSITVKVAGDYTCEVIAANGLCKLTTDTIKIRYKPLPVVTLDSINPVNPNLPAFNLIGGLPTGGVYSGTGVSNGMFDPAVAGLGTHKVTYSFTDTSGCVNTATRIIEVTNGVGLNINLNIKLVRIKPNPSKGVVNLELISDKPSTLNVKLIDQVGRIVFVKSYDEISVNHKKQLDFSDISKGLYYLQLTTGDKVNTSKLILE